MRFDLVLKGGRVVLPGSVIEADVGIEGEKIACLAAPRSLSDAVRTVDASGKYVLPGAVDAHVHFCLPFMGSTTSDDFHKGTVSAALGGVTTVIDFAIQKGAEDPLETIDRRKAQADGEAVVDYALHACLTDPSPNTVSRIPTIIDGGIPSFKVFMVYKKEGWMVDDGLLVEILKLSLEHGGLVGVHSENAAMCDYNVNNALARGRVEAFYHGVTKDNLTEAEAINRVLFIARSLGTPIYDFHMSAREGVEMFRRGRAAGLPFYAETCPRYLVLDAGCMKRPDGRNFICSPPLRSQDDIRALWQGLADGAVSVVASDHCAYSAEQKSRAETFDRVPNGFEGVQALLPVMFSEGVSKGRISVNRLVEVVSANPARIFGLYPRKGTIAPGSDADIVVVDPVEEKTMSVKTSGLDIDWNPFEGLKVKGYPALTVSRGRIIVDRGSFTGTRGAGRFLRRSIPAGVLSSPA